MRGEKLSGKKLAAFNTQSVLVSNRVKGLQSANSADLSRSYGLPIPDVKRILDAHGVKDHG